MCDGLGVVCVLYVVLFVFSSARKAEMKIPKGFRYQAVGFLICCKYFSVVEGIGVEILV